ATGTKLETIADGIRTLMAEGAAVTILAPKEAEIGRLRELLSEQGVRADDRLALEVGEISRGFHAPRLARALLTTRELFHQALVRRPPPRTGRRKAGRPIASFLELSPGDLVVHVVHGIGKFLSVERIENEGRLQEYLALEY